MSTFAPRPTVWMFDSTLAILEHEFLEYMSTGKPLKRNGNRHPFVTPFDTFMAADNQFVISCGNDQLFATLCSRPDLVFVGRFRPNFDRMTSNIVLKRELKATLKTQPAAHWRKIVHEAGVPVGPRLNVAEAAEHPRSRPAICRSRLAVSA